ncbi:hypothetical protein B0H15DRAFT_781278 [Mycena belliarum]|uniref:Uncharacterized protein n=1 Tax=Mycena belliarum TaxID=1033014 RepID=A0AAD6U3Z5_9AGAR|nr:hypothetical protein B0H15DRAFT_781278 [Mycena belliae]
MPTDTETPPEDYVALFSRLSKTWNDAAITNNYKAMQKLRREARKEPLRAGLRFTLPLKIPAQNPNSGSRPVPFVSTTEPATLELVEALQTGVDKTSQIWTARVMETPETVLVMKIVQLSMCVNPDLDHFFWGDWEYPPDFAPREAWVYARLRVLQGLYVPYFFGIHKVSTPSKETAGVLVLEYIPGQTIESFCQAEALDGVFISVRLSCLS